MSTARIPATVITGFLGAGKTTLIRNIIMQANGKRLALIVNEFGDIGMDGDMLQECGADSCSAEDIIELANGCICCTVADDFLPSIQSLLAQTPPPDHIIIETSGLALPQPLVQAFSWPDIRSRVMLDGVVTVVDGAALAAGEVVADADAAVRVGEAMARLPQEQLDVLQLGYFDGLSQSEIAEQLGLPLGTVKSRMRLALGRMRDVARDLGLEA